MRQVKWFLIALVCVVALAFTAPALRARASQPEPVIAPAQQGEKELVVGVAECLPFVIKDSAGQFSGLSITLFDRIASQLKLKYRFQEYSWNDLLRAVEDGKVDAAVSCITITTEREKTMDFSHAYFETAISVAVREPSLFDSMMAILLSQEALKAILILLALSLVVGGLMWLFEHQENEDAFPPRGRPGTIIEIFLAGLVFVTSGAFDHISYKTLPGRTLAALGKIANTIILTGITAIVVSALTSAMLRGQITDPSDLYKIRLAATPNTTAQEYLDFNQMKFTPYDTDLKMLQSLEQKNVDAVVQDAPLLQYLIKQGRKTGQFQNLTVLPWRLELNSYGFALPQNSALREPINRALLSIRQDPNWENIVDAYFKDE